MEKQDKDEVTAMLNNIADTVTAFMKAEGLMKAHEGEATASEVSPDDSATSAPAPEGSASAGGPPAAPAMDAAGPPMEGSGDSSSSSSSSSSSGGDPAMDGTSDVEALAREYDKLPLPELQAHYMAARTSLMAQMAAQGGGDQPGADPSAAAPMDPSASAGGPPAAPPAPPPAAAPAPDMEAMKSEAMSKAEKAVGAKLAELQKSLDAANARIAVQDQLVAATGKVLEKLQNRPVIKGIAEHTPAAMRKNEADVESMTKAEINSRLTAAARSGKLAKSDLNKITSFALGKIDVEGVKHLLVEA